MLNFFSYLGLPFYCFPFTPPPPRGGRGVSVYFTWNRLIDNDNSYYIYNRLFELSSLRIVEHYKNLGVLQKKLFYRKNLHNSSSIQKKQWPKPLEVTEKT